MMNEEIVKEDGDTCRDGHRCGVVAMAGRPNVGKSTLMNCMLGTKIAIVTPKPQTTRDRILGVLTLENSQILFQDAPGIHRSKKVLNRRMVSEAQAVIDDCDMALMVTDAMNPKTGPVQDERVIQRVEAIRRPVVLALNKVDLVAKPRLLPIIEAYLRRYDFKAIVPVCALTGDGAEALRDEITACLPEGPALYPADELSDRPLRFLAAEFVREKLMLFTRREVPYSTAVTIDEFKEPDPPAAVRITATIHVERSSQKSIVIGKGGGMLKRIGTAARQEIEQLLDRKVFLKLFVRVEEEWTRSERGLRRVGF